MVCCSCFSSAIWRQIAKLQGSSQRTVDWSEVPADVWWQIATRLDSCKDFLTFRGVCHSWRSLVDAKDFRQSERNPPWLSLLVCTVRVLPQTVVGVWPQPVVRWFMYSLRRRKLRQITWPELVGTREKCFSSKGWICIVDEKVEENLDINLVHPLSLARISLRGFKCCDDASFIYKVVLAASPSHSEDFMAMVIHGPEKQVAIWRQGGDKKGWTCLSSAMGPCSDVAYYGAQLYTLHDDGDGSVVLVYDVSRPNPVQVRSVPLRPLYEFPLRYRAYFVESSGKLLAVIRYSVDDFTTDSLYLTRAFIVFEFDTESGEWKQLLDLGDRSLFIGENSSFALQITSHASGFRPNCIYFTPDPHELYFMLLHYRGCNNREVGVYNLRYRRVRHCIIPKSCPRITSAQWIESSPC